MTEELTLEQASGQRGAADGVKRPLLARGDRSCSALASSSLPVPVSPRRRTLTSLLRRLLYDLKHFAACRRRRSTMPKKTPSLGTR